MTDKLTDYARHLRRDQTDVEKLFWSKVRNRQLGGYKFKRQHVIGSYIVDFYCAEKKLIIELDGGQHNDVVDYDKQRTAYLEGQGLTVMRFGNVEFLEDSDFKLDMILDWLNSH